MKQPPDFSRGQLLLLCDRRDRTVGMSKDKNIHARGKWFDEAKAEKLETWEQVAQGAVDG